MDSVSGMYWLKTRWYSPYLKRFVSPDQLFIAGDALTASNMYAYCNEDPVNMWDPTGCAAIDLGGSWWALKHSPHTSAGQYHWHVWKGKANGLDVAKLKYALNIDGSMHDKNSWSDQGGPPNSVKKALNQKKGFDWNARVKQYQSNQNNVSSLSSKYIQTHIGVYSLQISVKYKDGSQRSYLDKNTLPIMTNPIGVGSVIITGPVFTPQVSLVPSFNYVPIGPMFRPVFL